ncbi:hypothetical protein bcgnr5414_55790 [Bacillus cereus]
MIERSETFVRLFSTYLCKTMKLNPIYNSPIESIHKNFLNGSKQTEGTNDFGDVFRNGLNALNNQELKGENMMQEVLQGKSEQTHQALIEMEETSYKFGVAVKVRDKVIEMINQVQSGQI